MSTYRGVDREQGDDVVVKTVDAAGVSPAVGLRGAHEALILRRLEAPDFRPLVTMGRDGDVIYGQKALRLIRTVAPGAAIVLLTAVDRRDVSDDDLRETLGYLDKTLDLDALVRRLAGMLEPAA